MKREFFELPQAVKGLPVCEDFKNCFELWINRKIKVKKPGLDIMLNPGFRTSSCV